MNYSAHTVKTMFNHIARDSFERARQWFNEHPGEPYCYWAKDNFIAVSQKNDKVLLDAHPEIEDIDDHTIVQFDRLTNTVCLSRFCPKLRQGIKAMYDTGYDHNTSDGIYWHVYTDGNNFKMVAYEED